VAILVVLQPLLTTPFATSDDYVFLLRVLKGQSVVPLVLRDGRPLLGLLYDVVGKHWVHGVGDLWIFRALFVAFLWAASCLLWLQFRAAGWSSRMSATVALMFATCVGQVDLASLTSGHPVALSALLTVLAFPLGEEALRRRGMGRWGWAGLAVLFLVAALSTYQVPVFLWVLLCAAHLQVAPQPLGAAVRALFSRVAIPVVACGLYGLTFFVLRVGNPGGPEGTRAVLTERPLFRLAWFALFPRRDALNLQWVPWRDAFVEVYAGEHGGVDGQQIQFFLLQPATLVSMVTGMLMVAGLWTACEGPHRERMARVGLALCLLPAACFPNLVIQSLWAPLRTQVVLVTLVHFYLLLGARAAVRKHLPVSLPPWASHAALAAWVGLGVWESRRVAQDLVGEPLSCEWRNLLEEVKRAGPTAELVVLPATLADAAGPGMRYELGRPASAAPWAPIPMVEVARRELGLPPAERITVLGPDTEAQGRPVVHLGCRVQR
jgi:hypothetical protein